ncbi:MAG: alpha/beta hydrolase [Zetaproteobacteria bacterium]|nr:alpha/beta hydrolase [Zetaproteobacteria bacterium]
MKHTKVTFPGGDGQLVGLLHQGDPHLPRVIICHPHPLYGGTMRNKVVYWIARLFEARGHTVLRFNFRGVEESEGAWDEGFGESDDVIAAIDFLQIFHETLHEMQTDNGRSDLYWLAGFSFGAFAALSAARQDARIERMFAIAPAVNLWDFAFVAHESRRIDVVYAEEDEIVPSELLQDWLAHHPHIRAQKIVGAGHFFPDHKEEMCSALCDFIATP